MKSSRILFAVLFAGFFAQFVATPAHAIVGGTTVTANASSDSQSLYPWMGMLLRGNDQSIAYNGTVGFNCGVTLIGSRYALTAGHCVTDTSSLSAPLISTTNLNVAIGAYDRTSGSQTGQTVAVDQIIRNPNYNNDANTSDLALLVLHQDVTSVQNTIALTTVDVGAGKTAIIIGWGTQTAVNASTSTTDFATKLKQATVQTVSRASCQTTLNGSGFIVDANAICAGVAAGGVDSCDGDSGGPIFVVGTDGKPKQIGVSSWGVGCAQPNTPTAYSNIAGQLGFLLNNLGGGVGAKLVNYAVTNEQAQIARLFDALGGSAAADSVLRQDYGRLFLNSNAGITASLQSLLPNNALAVASAVDSFISLQSSALMSRMRNLRQGLSGGGLDTSGLHLNANTNNSVDPTTGLSTTNGVYGSSAGNNSLRTANANGNLTGDSLANNANQANSVASASVATNNGKMFDPSLYNNTTTNVSGQNISTTDAPITQAIQPATANEVNVVGYDSNGLPVRAGSPVVVSNKSQPAVIYGRAGALQQLQQVRAANQNNDGGIMAWVAGLFGGRSASETPMRDLPRNTAISSRDLAYIKANQYPGQPLGAYAQQRANNITATSANAGSNYDLANTAGDTNATLAANSLAVEPVASSQTALMANNIAVQTNSLKQPLPNQYALVTQADTATNFYSYGANNNNATKQAGYGMAAPVSINADRRWGTFVSGDVSFGREQLLRNGDSSSVNNTGITAGIDYRVADQGFIGAALSYAHGTFDGNYSDVRANGYALSLYGTTTYMQNAYVDGFLSFGYHTFGTDRTVFIGNNQTYVADANPTAQDISGQIETGYNYNVGDWRMGPLAGFNLAIKNYDSYKEADAGSFNLNVHGRTDISAVARLGAGVSRTYTMSNGGVWSPSFRTAYNHEFGDGITKVKSNLLIDSGDTFLTSGSRRERNFISVNPAVTASLQNNWSFEAEYLRDFLRYDINDNLFNLSAKYKW